jgi:hypothetical protein
MWFRNLLLQHKISKRWTAVRKRPPWVARCLVPYPLNLSDLSCWSTVTRALCHVTTTQECTATWESPILHHRQQITNKVFRVSRNKCYSARNTWLPDTVLILKLFRNETWCECETWSLTLILSSRGERVWKDSRRVDVKKKHLGGESERCFISEGKRKSILL